MNCSKALLLSAATLFSLHDFDFMPVRNDKIDYNHPPKNFKPRKNKKKGRK